MSTLSKRQRSLLQQVRPVLLFLGLNPEHDEFNAVEHALRLCTLLGEAAATSEMDKLMSGRMRVVWVNLIRTALEHASHGKEHAASTEQVEHAERELKASASTASALDEADREDLEAEREDAREEELSFDPESLKVMAEELFSAIDPDQTTEGASRRHEMIEELLDNVSVGHGKTGQISLRELEDGLRLALFEEDAADSTKPGSSVSDEDAEPKAKTPAEAEVSMPLAERVALFRRQTHAKFEPVREFFGVPASKDGNIFRDMIMLFEMFFLDEQRDSGIVSSKDEIKQRQKKAMRQVTRWMFDFYDTNEDGVLDRKELRSIVRDVGNIFGSGRQASADSDDDEQQQQQQGKSKEELELKATETAVNLLLSRHDKDQDGKLNFDEFLTFVEDEVPF